MFPMSVSSVDAKKDASNIDPIPCVKGAVDEAQEFFGIEIKRGENGAPKGLCHRAPTNVVNRVKIM